MRSRVATRVRRAISAAAREPLRRAPSKRAAELGRRVLAREVHAAAGRSGLLVVPPRPSRGMAGVRARGCTARRPSASAPALRRVASSGRSTCSAASQRSLAVRELERGIGAAPAREGRCDRRRPRRPRRSPSRSRTRLRGPEPPRDRPARRAARAAWLPRRTRGARSSRARAAPAAARARAAAARPARRASKRSSRPSRADAHAVVVVAQLAHGAAQPQALAELGGERLGERVVAAGQARRWHLAASSRRRAARRSRARPPRHAVELDGVGALEAAGERQPREAARAVRARARRLRTSRGAGAERAHRRRQRALGLEQQRRQHPAVGAHLARGELEALRDEREAVLGGAAPQRRRSRPR